MSNIRGYSACMVRCDATTGNADATRGCALQYSARTGAHGFTNLDCGTAHYCESMDAARLDECSDFRRRLDARGVRIYR